MSFGIIEEPSVLPGYSQNPSQSWTPKITRGDLMFKEDSSKPSEAVFNEDNNTTKNNNKSCFVFYV